MSKNEGGNAAPTAVICLLCGGTATHERYLPGEGICDDCWSVSTSEDVHLSIGGNAIDVCYCPFSKNWQWNWSWPGCPEPKHDVHDTRAEALTAVLCRVGLPHPPHPYHFDFYHRCAGRGTYRGGGGNGARLPFDYSNPQYKKARDEAFARSGGICQFCGLRQAKEAHHWELSYTAARDIRGDHLTALCQECHIEATLKRKLANRFDALCATQQN